MTVFDYATLTEIRMTREGDHMTLELDVPNHIIGGYGHYNNLESLKAFQNAFELIL